MGIIDRIINRKPVRVEHTEPNAIMDVGVDDIFNNVNEESVDWIDKAPDLIIPSVKNIRKCAETPLVHGILNDFVIKSISGYVITGNNKENVDYIIEQDKRWNLKELFYDVVMNAFIDGISYYQKVVIDNELHLRQLAFDGENYRMKELYDDKGIGVIGYVQRVLANENTNKGKLKRGFFEIYQDTISDKTVNFLPDEITAPCFFRRNGKPYSMVKNVLDTVYEIEMLKRMMPQVVYKNTNIMVLTVGNADRREISLSQEEALDLAKRMSDYHKKGITTLPYGISAELLGDNVLPKIEDYIKSLTSQVYAGLVSPEAIFSSSSSNRSTAVVQLDSDKSGRVLMQEFIQEKISRWVEQEIFDTQRELAGKETGTVWIDFNVKPEENEGAYNEEEAQIGTNNMKSDDDNVNVNPTDGLNMYNIRNAEGRI